MSDREELLEILSIILDDCTAQHDSLIENGDINWDCYQPANWYSLQTNAKRAIDIARREL